MDDRRIATVDDVELHARNDQMVKVRWFYGQLCELASTTRATETEALLRYRTGPVELRVRAVDRPQVDAVTCRVTVLVPNLEETAGVLAEVGHDYQDVSGLAWTDRALELLDPAGNRVRLKQYWPYAPL